MHRIIGGLALVVVAAACGETPGYAYLWAGNGTPGFTGDGDAIEESRLYYPLDVEFAPDGTPWVLDWNNHRLRRVTTDGTFATVVGTVLPGDGDPDQNDLTPAGAPGLEVGLNHPTDIQFDADGTLILAAWHNHKIRRVNPKTGVVNVSCGRGGGFRGDGGPASKALFNQLKAIVRAPDGTIFLTDQRNLRVRKIAPGADGIITTIAGDGTQGFAGDGGDPLAAKFNWEIGGNPEPSGALALDAEGRLYVADSLNHRIRRIDFAKNVIETIAGTGEAGLSGDGGPALAAKLNNPRDLELGKDGRLYVADTENHVVRAIDLAKGTIERVAGTGTRAKGEPDADAKEVALARPFGIAFDAQGNLYVSDTFNDRILKVVAR